MRSISLVIRAAILELSFLMPMLFLFRPYQLMGIKRKVIRVSCFECCFEVLYIITLQALGISHSKPSSLQMIPVKVITVISVCLQVYYVTNHICIRRTRRSHVKFFFQVTAAPFSFLILAIPVTEIVYPAYNEQNKDGKLLIALFSPLIGVFLKVISRVCVQRLYWKCIYPGYSYVLLTPLYFCSASMFRI